MFINGFTGSIPTRVSGLAVPLFFPFFKGFAAGFITFSLTRDFRSGARRPVLQSVSQSPGRNGSPLSY
jgi:hypothetical protein